MNVVAGKRGHNVSRAHLTDRAMFVRLETLRLARICGAGHYSCDLLRRRAVRGTLLCASAPRSDGPRLAGPRPLRAEQGSRGDRALSDPGRPRLLHPASVLDNYTRLGSPFGDHPNMKNIPGIDFSSGSLGHGLSIGGRHGAGGAGAEAQLPRLLHAGRRRAGRRPDLGSGHGRQPLPAAGPGRPSSTATSSASMARPRR